MPRRRRRIKKSSSNKINEMACGFEITLTEDEEQAIAAYLMMFSGSTQIKKPEIGQGEQNNSGETEQSGAVLAVSDGESREELSNAHLFLASLGSIAKNNWFYVLAAFIVLIILLFFLLPRIAKPKTA